MRFHFALVRMAAVRKTARSEGIGKEEPSYCRWSMSSCENQCGGISKTKIAQSCDPAIPLLGIHAENSISCPRDSCTSMFIAALFTTAKKWTPLRLPSMHGRRRM